jgi:hypothetical protein
MVIGNYHIGSPTPTERHQQTAQCKSVIVVADLYLGIDQPEDA